MITKKLPTVSIGIPAYNEEANIRDLLVEIVRQKQKGYKLKEIMVLSDGSTDDTVARAASIGNPLVHVINGGKRIGHATRQNEYFTQTYADIAVIINADTIIYDPKFLQKLITPIIEQRADLTSPILEPLKPRSFFESLLYISCKLKQELYTNFRKGNSVYTCSGPARAFSRKLYSELRFKHNVGEDAYSYLYCITRGFKYSYIKNTQIFYRLPNNFPDHQKQSLRFFQSCKLYEQEFGKDVVYIQYRIPVLYILYVLSKWLIKAPIHTLFYLNLLLFIRIKSIFINNNPKTWAVSSSSKYIQS